MTGKRRVAGPKTQAGQAQPSRGRTLSFGELEAVAKRAGATPAEARTMAAIALAESGGRVGILSNVPGAGDVGNGHGLWQIDKRYHNFDQKRALTDPLYNAQLAVKIMRDSAKAGKDPFRPWAAYNSGAYKRHQLNPASGVTAGAARDRPVAPGQQVQPTGGGAAGLKGILDMGMSFIGTPYKWGGNQPGGFDCSGLLQYIFAQNGVTIPRVSADQAKAGVAVPAQAAQAGDLLAFDNSRSRPGVDHIGIYLGNGLMLQAPRAGRNVEVVKVDLSRTAAIRRIPQVNTAGLQKQGNTFVYPAQAGQGATPPTAITAQAGGGDIATGVGYDPSSMLGPDGKVDPAKAIQTYGYIAELANSVPDIKSTLEKAITEGWEPSRFQAEIERTAWWKTTSEATRANEVLKKTNPGEYRRRRQQMIDKINILARQYGAKEGTQRVFILAERFLKLGSTDAEIERLIAADVRIVPTSEQAKPGGQTNTGVASVTVDALRERARAQEINLNDAQLQQWTSNILRGDLTMEAFESFLKSEAKRRHTDVPLTAYDRGLSVEEFKRQRSSEKERIRGQARDFLVPMSEAALDKWAGQLAAGDVAPEAFGEYLKEQAKSLFPTLGGAIDRGVTVAQYAEPYRQIAAQTLEINPDDVDFNDPVYRRALLANDPKTGERTSMGLSDFETYLRKQPAWAKTRAANERSSAVVETILNTFGKIA